MEPRLRRSVRARLAAPLRAMLGVAVVALVAGCTSSGGSPGGSASETGSPSGSASASSTRPDGPVTLRFAVYGDRQELLAYRRLARAYTKERPEVTVKVETSRDAGTAMDRLDSRFAEDRAPDLFLADSARVASLVQQQRVQPVDELLEERDVQLGDRFERLGLEAFAAESALQCMPNDVSPYVVFYNRRLLDLSTSVAPGETVPSPARNGWTWQQFALAAKAVSQGDVQGVYLPPRLTTLAPLLRSAGGDIVDDVQAPTTLTLSDPDARAAMEQILALARDARVNPTPVQLLREDAVTRFENDRLAMMVGTRSMVPRLRASSDLQFDVYPLPSLGRFETTADVAGYCISRTSPHVEAAADFMVFASGARGARITARSGGIVPANLEALRSRAFAQPNRLPSNAGVFTNTFRRAATMPNPLAWPSVVSRTQPLLGQLFYAPVLDLDRQLAEIDQVSAEVLATPTPSPSPSPSPTG